MKRSFSATVHCISAVTLALYLVGCGGGGGSSSPPTPSLTTNLPSSAFEDESIVVTVTAKNFGADQITYSANSNTLFIEQGASTNQFVLRGVDTEVGNHTISFSASDTSGRNATSNASIRIDVVPTGYWEMTSASVGEQEIADLFITTTVSREGLISVRSSFDGEVFNEKCFGSGSSSAATFTFEAWCVESFDGSTVRDEDWQGYRIAGEVLITGRSATGTYTLFNPSGGQESVLNIELDAEYSDRFLFSEAPTNPKGIYVGLFSDGLEFFEIDGSGLITTPDPQGVCEIGGSIVPIDSQLKSSAAYRDIAIYDVANFSQIGCVEPNRNFITGNRNIAAGVGHFFLVRGEVFGGGPLDEGLDIRASDSSTSYKGIPTRMVLFRVCSPGGETTLVGESVHFRCSNAAASSDTEFSKALANHNGTLNVERLQGALLGKTGVGFLSPKSPSDVPEQNQQQ